MRNGAWSTSQSFMRMPWNFLRIRQTGCQVALNAIELGVLTTERSEDGYIHITLDVAVECIQKRALKYDKNG